MLGATQAVLVGTASTVQSAATYVGQVLAKNPAWYLPLAESSGTTAAAAVGPDGAYVNAPQLGVDSIAQDDPAGKSVGLNGEGEDPAHIRCTSPLSGPDFTIDLIVQLDELSKPKYTLVTRAGSAAGTFGIEVLMNGQPRAYSYTSETGTFHEILGAAGNIQQGTAHKITYQRQSGVSPSQRLLVDGVEVASDPTIRHHNGVPAGTVYVGAWSNGDNAADGLVAHVAGWNRCLSQGEINHLVRPKNVVWAEDIGAGNVEPNRSLIISTRQGGWHGKTPLIVTAGNGSLVSTAESGDEITILAGPTPGSGDAFTYQLTDANLNTSPMRTIIVNVQGTSAGFLTGGINWAAQGYQLAWAGNPDPSLIGLSAAQIEAALTTDWTILSSPGAEQGWSVATRGGRTVLRCTMADDTPRGGNWHMRQLGSTGAGKAGAVLRYEVYLPHPGGYVNNDAGGKIAGLWGASPGVTHIPGGSVNYDDACSMRISWTSSQRFMHYSYIYNKNQAFGDSYGADDSINGDNVAGENNDGPTNNSSEHLYNHRNQWTRIESEIIFNTGTNADGIIRLYINGVLKSVKTGVKFTNIADALPMGLWINIYDNNNGATTFNEQAWDLYGFEIWVKP